MILKPQEVCEDKGRALKVIAEVASGLGLKVETPTTMQFNMLRINGIEAEDREAFITLCRELLGR